MIMIGTKNYLTQSELARQLDKSEETLRRWRRRGEGPSYIKFGSLVVYDPDTLTQSPQARAAA